MANNQVGQVKDQVGQGQGQGQELDNNPERGYKRLDYFVIPKYIQILTIWLIN